ncbi:hypothetical protein [Clostridium saccharoperbutylacetonicum]
MNMKGVISTIELNTARVKFPELDDSISYKLKIAAHVNMNDLKINDEILVCFFNSNLESGIIMAKI